MKVILDLQSLQTKNKTDVIASDTLVLAKALLRNEGEHQLFFSVNQTFFEKKTIDPVFFTDFPDSDRFLLWQSLEKGNSSDLDDDWRNEASTLIYEQFIQSQNPDLFHIPAFSFDERNNAVTFTHKLFKTVPTIVTVNDLSSLSGKDKDIWQQNRIDDIKKAELIIIYSEKVKNQLISLLGDDSSKISCLSMEVDNQIGHDNWDNVAVQLWSLYEQCLLNKAQKSRNSLKNALGKKLKLAYLSPLPPEKSGIADYSAEILPELSKHYDIDLITNLDVISDPYLDKNFKKFKIDDFHKYADKYDRIIYHFGNSIFHVQLYHLLEQYPGIVILHDFFIGGVFYCMAEIAPESHELHHQIFESHGYHALLKYWNNLVDGMWEYPANRQVIEMSSGVIVHSQHAMNLCNSWYGGSVAKQVKIAMLPRKVAEETDRIGARKRLGIRDDTFLVCAFGYMGSTKLNDRLLTAWLLSDLSSVNKCRLVFVGEGGGGPYEATLRKTIHAVGKVNIKITGFVSAVVYKDYLAAADVGVQLRTKSRGETSISILDGMACALPMIVNAHGAFAELPEDTVYMMRDEFSDNELRKGLERLYRDKRYRSELGVKGQEYVRTRRSLELAAQSYFECIEEFSQESPVAQQQTLIKGISKISVCRPTSADIKRAAHLICENNIQLLQRQIFVDVSVLAQLDQKTGIQRVVRSVLQQLLVNPPEGYRVEPVYRVRQHYRYARKFTCRFLGVPDKYLDDFPIETSRGDIFLGLDWDIGLGINALEQEYLFHHKQRGVKFIYVIYDILPLVKSACFPTEMEVNFRTWFEFVATISDGLACISRSVADEVDGWLSEYTIAKSGRPDLGYFHLGADIVSSKHSIGMSDDDINILNGLEGRTVLLMVGTIEPRKGYAQALSAIEQVWGSGVDVTLVIVGGIGWLVDELTSRIRKHPEQGGRLLWLDDASDELLMKLYDVSSALLMASEGEGFGLPLIEAAQHGLPIISRNLPVFYEVAGEHAYYFSNDEEKAFAKSILDWLDLFHVGKHPKSDHLIWQTWEQGTQQLLDLVIKDQWYIDACHEK